MGFLGIRFEGRGLQLRYKNTHICSFKKYTFYCRGLLNFADIIIFLQKKQHFFGFNRAFTQSNIVRAVIKLF